MEFSYATTTSESDWQQWARRNVDVADGGLSLTRTTAVRTEPIGDEIRDIAVDAAGQLYTLSTSGALAQYDPNTGSRRSLLHAKTSSVTTPQVIAASDTQLFVAGEASVRRISLQRGRETGQLQSTATPPSDLVYSRGTVYAVDDDQLVSLGDEQPTSEWPLDAPLGMDIAGEELYALDTIDGEPVVRRNADGETTVMVDSFAVGDEQFVPEAIAAPGGTVVAGTVANRGETAVFEWDPDSESFGQLTTLPGTCHRLVGRTGLDGFRKLYAIVGEDRQCLALTEVAENVRHPEQDKHVGVAVSEFDAGVDGIEWHRLAFDLARSSVNTQVRIWYRATEREGLLTPDPERGADPEWLGMCTDAEGVQPLFEPERRRSLRALGVETVRELTATDATVLAARGDSLSVAEISAAKERAFDALEAEIEAEWTLVTETDSQDILLRNATGRYLDVAIELHGTPTASPLVDSMTAYCPRQSYLRHMPELYQQDGDSAAFLEQFLSVFETSFTEIQAELEDITQYFDPAGTPSESLAWIEDWLAADEYRDWPESARREYLARAPELYKLRGTRAGLREIIELYLRHATDGTVDEPGAAGSDDTVTGHRLFFLDRSDLEAVRGPTAVEAFESLLPNERSLALFCGPFESESHREAIETIVATEKPAHIDATVHTLDEEFVLGRDTLLGLNSKLGTQSFSLGDATLGKDSYLGASD
jgi:phage tail-like protein